MAIFLVILIAIFALRSVLFIPGIIGHTWDWGIPNFPEQFQLQTEASFFIWDNRTFGGFFFPTRIELPYWLLNLIFSSLGGEVLSKVVPLLILIIAGLAMFFTVRKIFLLNYFWALIPAILYMLSPFSYSRLIGGHLPILLGYAFLPLVFYSSVSLFGLLAQKNTSRAWWSKLVFLTLILTLGILHPLTLLVSWIVIFLTAGVFFILRGGERKGIAKKFFLVLVFWTLLNSYWLLPVLSQLVKGLGELSIRPWQPITGELSFRLLYFSSASHPLSELFSFSFPFGLNTEFVYPLPDLMKPLFILLSVILFATSIVTFYLAIIYLAIKRRKKYLPVILILTLIELIGFTLVAGEKTIIGRLFFFILIRLAPFIFSVVSNPLRLLPLVVLPLFVLFVVTLATIEERLGYFGKMVLKGFIVFGLLVFFYPWFFHNLTTPVIKYSEQPMSLKVTKINPEDKKVFDYLKGFKEDFRVTYLPPPFVSWPGETDLSYSWNTIYSPKPVFLEYSQPILAGEIINSLYSQKSSRDLSKLLGLGAVKTIIYPHYQQFESYQDFIKDTKNYKPIVDRNWTDQNNIQKKTADFKTVDIHENENFVPHVFIPEQVTFIQGEKSSLTDIVSFPDYQIRNAIFFPEKDENKILFAFKNADNIYVKPSFIGGEVFPQIRSEELYPTTRFLPTSPFYILTYLKDRHLWNTMQSYPKLRANTDLVLMGKRLYELKRMVELKQDTAEVGTKTVKRYQTLLNDLSDQLDGLAERQETDNSLLIKSRVFLDDHKKNFNYIIQKTESGEVINGIKQIFEKMDQVFPKIKENIWVTEDEREKKFLFTIPEDGNYFLFASSEIGDKLNFEIDGKLFATEGELLDSQWLSSGKLSLSKGNHCLKVNLAEQSNLFSGIATSSAVKKSSALKQPDHSYQFFAQKENEVINAHLTGLDDRAKYKVSFKYRVLGNPIRLTFEQANDEEVKGFIKHKIDTFLAMDEKWKKFEAVFSPNFDSHEVDLKFYLTADKDQIDTSFIEEIKVEQVLVPNLLFKKEKKIESTKLPKITFFKVNPTKYKVKIEEATTPYFLVFSETFHKGWKAYIKEFPISNFQFPNSDGEVIVSYFDGQIQEGEHKNIFLDREIFANAFQKPIPEENHLLVNAFANAWYIDQPGSYEVTLEFIPQRIYFLGLWVSFISFVFALGYLGIWLIKQRKKFL
jgi:hypothetical protein